MSARVTDSLDILLSLAKKFMESIICAFFTVQKFIIGISKMKL